MDTLLANLTDGRFKHGDTIIAESTFTVSNEPELSETAFGNFVTDSMRLMGAEVTGRPVDFAFQANGVIRGSLTPGTLAENKGKVTLFDLVNQVGMGFGPDGNPGYPLVSIYFTGEEVRRILEIAALLPQLKGDAFFLQVSGLRMSYDPARAILATIPIKNIPIPTGRAVLTAERYSGQRLQDNSASQWTALERKDDKLYHVVSDYYLAAFLPMVGDLLPKLGLVMKDQEGNPVDVEDCIVYRDGSEYKIWQAVLDYTDSLPQGKEDLPEIPVYYKDTNGRLLTKKTLSLWFMPLMATTLTVAAILAYRRGKRHCVWW